MFESEDMTPAIALGIVMILYIIAFFSVDTGGGATDIGPFFSPFG